jgi:predicted amidophosphoribosyltransferase
MDDSEWDDNRPLADWESPDDDDADDQATTTVCRNCRSEMYDDTEHCPHCGEYVTSEQADWSRFPPWVYAGAVAALIGIVGSLLYFC